MQRLKEAARRVLASRSSSGADTQNENHPRNSRQRSLSVDYGVKDINSHFEIFPLEETAESVTDTTETYDKSNATCDTRQASSCGYPYRGSTMDSVCTTPKCTSQFSSSSDYHIFNPPYLTEIPEAIATEFGKDYTNLLEVKSTNFRNLVRYVCKFPAYFGLVMFQRIIEYRQMAFELVAEGKLPYSSLDYVSGYTTGAICSSHTFRRQEQRIGLRDFLRFWTPEIRSQSRSLKLIQLLSPPTKKNVLGIETETPDPIDNPSKSSPNIIGFLPSKITVDYFRPLVEALVDRHPDLKQIKDNIASRQRYVTAVVTNIDFTLGIRDKRISAEQLHATNIPNLFFKAATRSVEDMIPFSVRFFATANRMFQSALDCMHGHGIVETRNSTADAYITLDSLNACVPFKLNSTVLRRLGGCISYGRRGPRRTVSRTLMFEDLVKLLLVVEDGMEQPSAQSWFQALDLDDDGYLSRQDLEILYREKLDSQGVFDEKRRARELESVVCIVLDMIPCVQMDPRGHFRMSALDIRRWNAGPLMFELFVRCSTDNSEKSVGIKHKT